MDNSQWGRNLQLRPVHLAGVCFMLGFLPVYGQSSKGWVGGGSQTQTCAASDPVYVTEAPTASVQGTIDQPSREPRRCSPAQGGVTRSLADVLASAGGQNRVRDTSPARPENMSVLTRLETGTWRTVSREEGLLLLFELQEGIDGSTGAADPDDLTGRLSTMLRLIETDAEEEFTRNLDRAIHLAMQGKRDEALGQIQPYLSLDDKDPLLSAACQVAAWVHFRELGYKACRSYLRSAPVTERTLYMWVVSCLGDGLRSSAAEGYRLMEKEFPSGKLTQRLAGLFSSTPFRNVQNR